MPIKRSRFNRYMYPAKAKDVRRVYLEHGIADDISRFVSDTFKKSIICTEDYNEKPFDVAFLDFVNVSVSSDGIIVGKCAYSLPEKCNVVFIRVNIADENQHDISAITAALVDKYKGYMMRCVDNVTDANGKVTSFWLRAVKKKPVAMLLMSRSGSGKSSFADVLRTADNLMIIQGDNLVLDIARSIEASSDGLHKACEMCLKNNNISRAIKAMIESGTFEEFLDIVCMKSSGADFLFEMWVPINQQYRVYDFFERKCKVVVISTERQHIGVVGQLCRMFQRLSFSFKK